MKPFIFKLQTALELKLKQEELQKEAVGKLQREYMEQMALLNKFEEKLLYLQEQLRQQQKEAMELPKIRSYEEYMPVLNNKIDYQEEQVEKLLDDINRAREVLISLMQERKVLEKLKDKKFEDYQKQVLIEEQKSIDEMAMNAYLNKEMPQI